jgi:hypothetical protein
MTTEMTTEMEKAGVAVMAPCRAAMILSFHTYSILYGSNETTTGPSPGRDKNP